MSVYALTWTVWPLLKTLRGPRYLQLSCAPNLRSAIACFEGTMCPCNVMCGHTHASTRAHTDAYKPYWVPQTSLGDCSSVGAPHCVVDDSSDQNNGPFLAHRSYENPVPWRSAQIHSNEIHINNNKKGAQQKTSEKESFAMSNKMVDNCI